MNRDRGIGRFGRIVASLFEVKASANRRLARAVQSMRRRGRVFVGRLPDKLARLRARYFIQLSQAWIKLILSCTKYSGVIKLAFLCLMAAISVLISPLLQDWLAPHVATEPQLGALRTLFVTLGGNVLGASAIAFSVVMLAVQLNFARIPHALFRKLSQDFNLMLSFALVFAIAILISSLSLIPNSSWAGLAIIVGLWGVAVTLVLFLRGYRRALSLINPAVQLGIIIFDVKKSMRRWSKLADRSIPLIKNRQNGRLNQDVPRAIFLRSNPHWEEVPLRAIKYSMSFAERYAEQREYDVSWGALRAIVEINEAYIGARGKTFFASNPIFVNPLSSERFINETLEQLRILGGSAAARGDEQQTTQIMRAMSALVNLYATIDYGQDYGAKLHHAQLAASYLTGLAEASVRRFEADVLMEGVRLIGGTAQVILRARYPVGVVTQVEKLAAFSVLGVAKPALSPLTTTGVEQLAKLTYELIRAADGDVSYPLRQARLAVMNVARAVVSSREAPLSSAHSSHMSPYFSLTRTDTFSDWFTGLTNALVSAPSEDVNARRIIANIDTWSDQLYSSLRELLVESLKHSSGLTFDLVAWTCHVVKLLAMVSRASAAGEHYSAKIRKNAISLFWTFDWIPDDRDIVTFAENYSITENVFEVGYAAFELSADDIAEAARSILLNWAFKGGRHRTGWGIFGRAITAVAVLCVGREGGDWDDWLKAEVARRLANDAALPREERPQTATALRTIIEGLGRDQYPMSPIDQVALRVDRDRLMSLLNAVVDLLAPLAPAAEPEP